MKQNINPFTDPNAPRAPFEPGSIARAHGLSPKNESEALALCVQHGIDKEVATADTLAQLAATFDI